MKKRDRRSEFVALLTAAGITQARAAQLIAEETKRPCSVRAVRAWLAPDDRPSARTLPDWAIAALERRLKTLRFLRKIRA